MQRTVTVIGSVFLVVAFSASAAVAQQLQGKCPHIEYSEHPTNPHAFRLKSIEGQAAYGGVSEKGEFGSASGICVYLFDRKDRRLVADVRTENGGQFTFPNIGSGKYVLIVSLDSLHEIIVPVEVANGQTAHGLAAHNSSRASFKPWQLLLHLRTREDRERVS